MPDGRNYARHRFLGIDAEGWERARVDDLPVSPFAGELTVDDVLDALAAMLRRMDEGTD